MKFIIEAIGVKSRGGIELALSLFSHFGRSRNHEFVALVPRLPQYAGIERNGLRVVRLRPDLGLANRYYILNRRVPRICRDEGASALLCLGNFAPGRPPCPAVVLLQNAWNVYNEPVAAKRLTLHERLTVAYGRRFFRGLPPHTRVVVQTSVMKERLAAYHGLARRKIDVIPSAPPAIDWNGHPPPQATAGPRAVFTFLCLSGYGPHKNLEVLIDSARILRRLSPWPFRCLLTLSEGEHPGARKLLARIRREGMESVLVNVGPVSRSQLSRIYARADACLLPTMLETVGFAYDEAMQFGLPILTSDRDFSRARCQEAAIYFDPLRPESVAAAMSNVMTDRELRSRLLENGKKRLSQAPGWEHIAARFISVLERAARNRDQLPGHEYALSSSTG
jgi:glycosyltransferase involved in cell wall biosynthesis